MRSAGERFDAEFAKAVAGTGIEPRALGERTTAAAKRLSKAAARKPISALAGT